MSVHKVGVVSLPFGDFCVTEFEAFRRTTERMGNEVVKSVRRFNNKMVVKFEGNSPHVYLPWEFSKFFSLSPSPDTLLVVNEEGRQTIKEYTKAERYKQYQELKKEFEPQEALRTTR